MADYGVNIAVAVKNTQAITQLSGKIKETGLKVDQLNNLIENFADITGTTVVNSVRNFNKALSDAGKNLNNAALDTKAATEAARDYIDAQNQVNAALKEQQNLLRAVRLEGKTVSDTPFGPKPAPGFDPVKGRQKAVARMVMMETAAEVKIADARRKYVLEIGQIKLDLDRKIRNAEIDNIIEQYRIENELQDSIFKKMIELSDKQGAKFMEDLGLRKNAELSAIAEVDKARKKAAGEAVRLTGQTSPIGGAVGIPGSPAALAAAERAKRLQRAGGSALIGGAFPLLFGQGLGAAFGGAAGGFGGGMLGGEFGFGLSLVGTQIGSLIDQLATRASELGKALNPATADVDALVEALGLVGSPAKDSIDALRELAGEQAALEAATSQLSLVVGDEGVEALKNLGEASTSFGNALAQVTTQVLAEVARLTGGITQRIAEALQFEADLTAAKASKDPKMAVLQGQLANVNVFEDVVSGRERAVIENQMVELQRELRKEEEAALEAAVDRARIGSAEHTIAKNNLAIAKLDGDLTDERVFRLEKANIFQEAIRKSQQEGADQKLIELERDEQLLQLTNRRNSLLEAATEKADRLSKKEQRAIQRRIDAVDREIVSTTRAFNKADSQLDDIINKNKDKIAFEKEYARLIQQGSTPAAAKQAIELQKQLRQLDRTYDKLIERLDVEVLSLKASIEKARAEGATEEALKGQIAALEEIERKIAGLEGKKEGAEGAINEALAPKTDRENLEAYLTKLQEQLNDLLNPANQVIALAETLGSAFSESFKGIVDGSMSAREALANLFQRTADHFLDMAAKMIAAQIKMQAVNLFMSFFPSTGIPVSGSANPFPGHPTHDKLPIPPLPPLPGKALGGAVGAGRPYMVGERGPELFVPGAQGNIVPNNAMGSANVTVNVDASGSSVEGNSDQAAQLGRMLGAAVQAELVKQKRPGGLLAS